MHIIFFLHVHVGLLNSLILIKQNYFILKFFSYQFTFSGLNLFKSTKQPGDFKNPNIEMPSENCYYCRVSSISGILRNRFSLLGGTRGNTGKGEGLSIVPEIQNLPQPPNPGCTTPIPSGGREGNKSYIFVATSRGLCSFLEFEFFKGSGSPEPNNPSPPCDLHFACTGHAIGCATRNSCLEV